MHGHRHRSAIARKPLSEHCPTPERHSPVSRKPAIGPRRLGGGHLGPDFFELARPPVGAERLAFALPRPIVSQLSGSLYLPSVLRRKFRGRKSVGLAIPSIARRADTPSAHSCLRCARHINHADHADNRIVPSLLRSLTQTRRGRKKGGVHPEWEVGQVKVQLLQNRNSTYRQLEAQACVNAQFSTAT